MNRTYRVTIVADVEAESQEAAQELIDVLLDMPLVDSYQATVEHVD